jgi:YgiT-type zinc finger domain-containing protein
VEPERKEITMHCPVCEIGEVRAGHSTVSVEQKEYRLVINNVPARVCQNCGENYIDDETKAQLLRLADIPAPQGVRVDIREYSTAFAA